MTTPLFATSILGKGQTWVLADGSNAKKDLTAVATGNGMLIAAISCVSDDTSARLVQLFLNDGSTDFLVATISVATLSGTDGTNPPLNLLGNAIMTPWVSSSGDIPIPSGWKLKGATTTTITTGKTVTVVAIAGSL